MKRLIRNLFCLTSSICLAVLLTSCSNLSSLIDSFSQESDSSENNNDEITLNLVAGHIKKNVTINKKDVLNPSIYFDKETSDNIIDWYYDSEYKIKLSYLSPPINGQTLYAQLKKEVKSAKFKGMSETATTYVLSELPTTTKNGLSYVTGSSTDDFTYMVEGYGYTLNIDVELTNTTDYTVQGNVQKFSNAQISENNSWFFKDACSFKSSSSVGKATATLTFDSKEPQVFETENIDSYVMKDYNVTAYKDKTSTGTSKKGSLELSESSYHKIYIKFSDDFIIQIYGNVIYRSIEEDTSWTYKQQYGFQTGEGNISTDQTITVDYKDENDKIAFKDKILVLLSQMSDSTITGSVNKSYQMQQAYGTLNSKIYY